MGRVLSPSCWDVASGKIDQRGTGEGNKADGEYRYCNGRRYCHYSGPYTDHASTQWSPDPSKEVPTPPLCLISSSICRLLRSKWTLLAQHHNAGCGRPAGHLISSISHRPPAAAPDEDKGEISSDLYRDQFWEFFFKLYSFVLF